MRLRKAFTLVELLVVMGILAVLASGLIAVIDPVDKINLGNDSKVESDISQIITALQNYATQNNGVYPPAAGWDTTLQTSGELSKVPVPPTGYGASYTYATNGTQTQAKLGGSLKAKKNTTSAVGTWCWDSSLGTAGLYKGQAVTAGVGCP